MYETSACDNASSTDTLKNTQISELIENFWNTYQ